MSKYNWAEIKMGYICGKMSYAELHKTYGAALRTISERARKEEWVAERERFRTESALKIRGYTIDQQARAINQLTDAHATMAAIMSRIADEASRFCLICDAENDMQMMSKDNARALKTIVSTLNELVKMLAALYGAKGGCDARESGVICLPARSDGD